MNIWKWEIPVTDRQTVAMPAGAKILDVQMQHDACCIWALCDPTMPAELRHIAMYGTGHPITGESGEYIASFQMAQGMLVFHAFELKE